MNNNFVFECLIDDQIIKEFNEAMEAKEMYDSWGDACYGNDKYAVYYNMYIDSDGEQHSAFYRFFKGENEYWQQDDYEDYYEYNIDFNNPNWLDQLGKNAVAAYVCLFE